MSQENIGAKAFIAGVDLEAYRRVKLSSGTGNTVEYADAGEAFIGVTAAKVSAGDFITVNLLTRSRTFKVVADAAIGEGVSIYGGDDGKVGVTVSGSTIGTALELSTSDLEVIEGLLS